MILSIDNLINLIELLGDNVSSFLIINACAMKCHISQFA